MHMFEHATSCKMYNFGTFAVNLKFKYSFCLFPSSTVSSLKIFEIFVLMALFLVNAIFFEARV